MRRYTFLTWGVVWRIALLMALITLAGWIYGMLQKEEAEPAPEPEVLSGQSPSIADIPAITSVVIEADDTVRVLQCTDAVCDSLPLPIRARESEALYDGSGWYYYRETEDEGVQLVYLKGEDEKLLVDETDLTQPREMYMAPDGRKLAYFLDNKESEEGLTELWMYDTDSGGTQLLVEKLVAPDILTKPRWNKQGTALFFLADSGKGEEEKVELVVVQANSRVVSAQFLQLDFTQLKSVIEIGAVDIDSNASAIALGQPAEETRPTQLVVARESGSVVRKSVVGRVAYTQWLEGGKLLYALDHAGQTTFLVFDGQEHTPLAKLNGSLVSAHGEATNRYVSLAMTSASGPVRNYTLDVRTGLAKDVGVLPVQSDEVYIVHSKLREASLHVSDTTTDLSDTQIVTFVDTQAEGIIGSDATPVRIVTTNESNMVYLDYVAANNETSRILLLVQDVVHPEWDILGRYSSAAGEWHRTEGGSQTDPKPRKLYEWEAPLEQWVLKKEFLSGVAALDG